MWSKDFPRLYELYLSSDITNPKNYFANFENLVDVPQYKRLEKDLQQLDSEAWQELKQKACKYVATKDRRRAYEQLFNCLSEVKGYLYLKSEGCTNVHLIPQENSQTPDLYGCCGSSEILMEVKSINISDKEINYLKENSELRDGRMQAREVLTGLSDSLKRKIIDTINTANKQLLSYPCNGIKRKIVYLVIKLDLELSLNSSNFDELENYLQQLDSKQIEVKYCYRGWQT